MKKILLYILGGLVVLGLGLGLYMWSQNTPRPIGKKGPEADAMVEKMFNAVDKAAWDTTSVISWSFPGGHDYVWDKINDRVEVSWGNNRVLLNTKMVDGVAFENSTLVPNDKDDALIQTAWSYFCNDSWWLNPTVKAQDPGTEASVVTLEDGREGLMIEYSSGGVTPGDAYVYILDENGFPSSYLMWVSIIPVGGMEIAFSNWTTLYSGAKIAIQYPGAFTLNIENVKSGPDLTSIGMDSGLFDPLTSS